MRALAEWLRIEEIHRIAREVHKLFVQYAPGTAKAAARCAQQHADAADDEINRLAVEPVRIKAQRGMRLHARQEHHKRHHRYDENFYVAQHMRCGERLVIRITERQIAVQQVRIYAIEEAEHSAEAHAQIHVLRQSVFNFYVLVRITQEDKVTHLQGNGQEGTYAGKLQQCIYPIIASGRSSSDSNRLADEAVEERYTGDGERCHEEAGCHERHPLRHAAELVNLAYTRCINNRTSAHEQQRFIQNMREGMGSSTIQRHRRANANAGNHEADLADDMVAQEAAHIVFHNRISGTIKRHEAAKAHEEVRACKDTDQRVHSNLRGEGAEEDAAGNRALRIGIDQPGVDRRDSCVDSHADQYSPEGQVMRSLGQISNKCIAATNLEEDTEQQKVTAQHMHQKIAQTCTTRGRSVAAPDQKQRGDSQCLPEENQGQPILRQRYAKGAACVGHGAQGLHAVLIMAGVQAADARHERKYHAEHIAELVNVHIAKLIACTKEFKAEVRAHRHGKRSEQGEERADGQNKLAQHFRHEHRDYAHGNEDQTRMKQITHRPHLP